MDVVHLEIDDPRWPDALRRLRHDFYHLPAYVRLDGAHPMAFLARSGDEELFVPYLLRCESLWPESMGGREVYDVVSAYGYPGLLLSDAARRSPRFARDAGGRLRETLRALGACSAFLRTHSLLSDGLSELFSEGFFTAAGETVAIDLTPDEGELWNGIREGHQWTIKKCRKQGFVPRMVPLAAYIECVMEIYRDTMDRVQVRKSYYFGRDYFERLGEMPGQVHCCVVESQGRPAPACISSNATESSRPTGGHPVVGVPEPVAVSPAPLPCGGGMGQVARQLLPPPRRWRRRLQRPTLPVQARVLAAALSVLHPAVRHGCGDVP